MLAPGKPDNFKGSYYVNVKEAAKDVKERYNDLPEYTADNIWPEEVGVNGVEGFKQAFQELCELIVDTAGLVAAACDQYAEANIPDYPKGYLEKVVKESTTTKARLLHYFATPEDYTPTSDDDWCGTHLDHGCLTGLTSALFFNGQPDENAGLWIQDREGKRWKVDIPEDCLAFQTGEALERITKGRFKAVPHLVRGSVTPGVSRSTLAVFTRKCALRMRGRGGSGDEANWGGDNRAEFVGDGGFGEEVGFCGICEGCGGEEYYGWGGEVSDLLLEKNGKCFFLWSTVLSDVT